MRECEKERESAKEARRATNTLCNIFFNEKNRKAKVSVGGRQPSKLVAGQETNDQLLLLQPTVKKKEEGDKKDLLLIMTGKVSFFGCFIRDESNT